MTERVEKLERCGARQKTHDPKCEVRSESAAHDGREARSSVWSKREGAAKNGREGRRGDEAAAGVPQLRRTRECRQVIEQSVVVATQCNGKGIGPHRIAQIARRDGPQSSSEDGFEMTVAALSRISSIRHDGGCRADVSKGGVPNWRSTTTSSSSDSQQ